MNTVLYVQPLPEAQMLISKYDLMIATCGYEERARHAASVLRSCFSRIVAPTFADQHVLSFGANKAWFDSQGADTRVISDAGDVDKMRFMIEEARTQSGGSVSVCLDISSMSRSRLSNWVAALQIAASAGDVACDFCYSLASLDQGPGGPQSIEIVEPIGLGFVAAETDPHLPLIAIVGLGFEPDRALGALELLEPREVRVWIPSGRASDEYASPIRQSNHQLLAELPAGSLFAYDVTDAYGLFVRLESLIDGALRNARAIMVPFGPKIFAAVCLLVSVAQPRSSVWRITGGSKEAPQERRALGPLVGIRTRFSSGPDPDPCLDKLD